MQEMFGGKVYRLALPGGITCPNRDGCLNTGGCIFCSAEGSGDFAPDAALSMDAQIEAAKAKVASKLSRHFAGYMAYFQSFTATYWRTPAEEAAGLARFAAAAAHPEILALSIATRPDCLPQRTVEALSKLQASSGKPIWVELGLQTIHEDTAAYIHRGYPLDAFEDALRRLKAADLRVVVHVIVGLPGEDAERTRQTVAWLARQPIDGIKLQILQVLKGTALADLLPEEVRTDFLSGRQQEFNKHQVFLKDGMRLPCYNMDEYVKLVTELAAMLPQNISIHRLTGDPPKSLLISPLWAADKKRVLNQLSKAAMSAGGKHV